MPLRILLVEDERDLAGAVQAVLQQQGHVVDHCPDGLAGWSLLGGDIARYDLAIVDWMLPGLSGLEVLRQWRAQSLTTPVLILTARSSWAERIDGLKAGADDYLSKPFHPEELVLRIQALLRRAHGLANQPQLQAAGLALDEERQCVMLHGQSIELTGAEFRLLRYFMLHPGQLLSKGQLSDHLYDGESERDSNVLEVHVNRLRNKLGKAVIETRRGQGYRYVGQS